MLYNFDMNLSYKLVQQDKGGGERNGVAVRGMGSVREGCCVAESSGHGSTSELEG